MNGSRAGNDRRLLRRSGSHMRCDMAVTLVPSEADTPYQVAGTLAHPQPAFPSRDRFKWTVIPTTLSSP